MPPTGSNHHCPVCGKAGFCKKHQVKCEDPCHEGKSFTHLKTEGCKRCEEVKKAEERRQEKEEEDAKKEEEKKKKKKNEFKE
ncbi:hypothetical protein KC338_g413 [Hortaea werneckii]|nr:hypothetical protein KC338_g413 [Hortaea werneckii]